MIRLEARFFKKGVLKNISHLDVVRLFQRAVRRANLPVALSQGYSPHYKITFGEALKLGLESESEKVEFRLDKWMDSEEFLERLNEKLPEGIKCRKKY